MRLKILAAAAGLFLAATSTHALAAQDIAFYQGVVTSGYDLTGLFGAAGASLAGDKYTEYFYIDTSKGFSVTSSSSLMTMGGSAFGASAPVSATITINGHTETITGAYSDLARTGYNAATGRDEIYDSAQDYTSTATGMTNNSISGGVYATKSALIPDHYDGYNLAVDNTSVFDLASAFSFHTTTFSGSDVVDTYGTLQATSAAPEPSTWLLMIAGIGGIGLIFRQAKRKHGFTLAAGLSN
ncbi:MAG: PEP-CTERM sorting domain-containing protein [Caulobacteraceae bacterium]